MSEKRVIFVASQKGGVGKTTFARGLLDCLRRHGSACAAYDADGRVGQLPRHSGSRDADGRLLSEQDPLHGVDYFDIRVEADRDVLLNALERRPDVILFDLPGGVVHEIAKVLDDDGRPTALLRAYERAGYRVTVVAVMTPMLASVRTVQDAQRLFGDAADLIAVKNLAFGDAAEFVLFDGYTDDQGRPRGGHGKQALLAQGGRILHLPKLQSRTYALLDLDHLSFAAAVDDPRLTLADRSRVFRWRTAFDEALREAGEWLGLTPAAQAAPDRADPAGHVLGTA